MKKVPGWSGSVEMGIERPGPLGLAGLSADGERRRHGEMEEVIVIVVGNISSYDPGRLDGPPDRCYPAEGGDVEIESVSEVPDKITEASYAKRKFVLTDAERAAAEDLLREKAAEEAEDSFDEDSFDDTDESDDVL